MIVSLDTNVLVYAYDGRDALKQSVARQVVGTLAAAGAPVALQTVGEFQSALTRRLKRPLGEVVLQSRLVLSMFDFFGYGQAEVELALIRVGTGRLSYWDGLLIASAETAGVEVMLSEDMGDGIRYGAVTVINPFGPAGLSERARIALES